MGKLFVIEGTDASGKQTQLKKLKERFNQENIGYKLISFPNYESESSIFVKMYLSGEFGDNEKEVSPYVASTFFAIDRYVTFKRELEEYYNNGGIILADRYVTANMVHQAGKIPDKEEREKFLEWLWDFEFNLYKLPIPTKVFFLDMPPEYAFKLMKNRENKFTHKRKKDIHERDKNHIIDSYNAACEVASKYNWTKVECVQNSNIRSRDEIHEDIYKEILNLM